MSDFGKLCRNNMQMHSNTLLITGGSSGIGLALAERFLALGNEVIVCGRRAGLLAELKAKHPGIHTIVSDTGRAADREALAAEVLTQFPKLNGLINNAGIQNKFDLKAPSPWSEMDQEIAVNIEGPMHLTALLTPHLLAQPRALVANVSSGLAFVPLTAAPVYSATKAFVHSYTQSLRHQLRGTSVGVVEIIPPAVRTNLGGSHDFGEPLADYADSVMAQLAEGRAETTYTFSAKSSQASRAELDGMFAYLNP